MEKASQWPAIAQSLGLFVDVTEASVAREVISQLSRTYEQNLKEFETAWITAILRRDNQLKATNQPHLVSVPPSAQPSQQPWLPQSFSSPA